MATPISAMIGPRIDQVAVLLIALPDTAPNPCNANSRPASATITPSTKTMTLRMTSTVATIVWRRGDLATERLPLGDQLEYLPVEDVESGA